MNALRLFFLFFRIGLMNELQYRASFFIQLAKSLQTLVISLTGVAVVYAQTPDLNGWSPAELVALLGVFIFMGGVIGLVIAPSMEKLIEDVRQGTLDFTLTKPQDALLLVSISQVRIWRVFDVVLGPALAGGALFYLGWHEGVTALALFAVTLMAGAAIMYSFWLILATMAFWFVRVDNIMMIFHSMYDAARWPVSIYPGWLRAALTFLVPVTFAVTVPSEALIGRLDNSTLAATMLLAAALLVGSRVFWKVGLKRYSGASA